MSKRVGRSTQKARKPAGVPLPKGLIRQENEDGTIELVELTLPAIVRHCTNESVRRFKEHGESLTPKGERLIASAIASALHYVDQLQRRSSQLYGGDTDRAAPKHDAVMSALRSVNPHRLYDPDTVALIVRNLKGKGTLVTASYVREVRRSKFPRPRN